MHIRTGFSSGDRPLMRDSIVREGTRRCLCPTSCVELRGVSGWWLVLE
jgi:hypothetical protein